jgi:predicted nucleic acid-binding protein
MALARLEALGLDVVPATSERAVRAALIKLNRKIPYVDAFGVELEASSSGQVLVTADSDLKPASQDV